MIYFTVNKQNLQDNHTMPVYIEALRRRLLQIPGPADTAPRQNLDEQREVPSSPDSGDPYTPSTEQV
jgi:hypothetical protein